MQGSQPLRRFCPRRGRRGRRRRRLKAWTTWMEPVSFRIALNMIFEQTFFCNVFGEALLDSLMDDLLVTTVYSSSRQPDLLPRVSFKSTGDSEEYLENRYVTHAAVRSQ